MQRDLLGASVQLARQLKSAASKLAGADEVGKLVLVGVLTTLALVGGFGVWAATADLSGAVLAQGSLVVETRVKKVQHPTGGIVGEIRVRDGDRVTAGDILLRLDETIVRANLSIVLGQLDELAIRQARLKAERDGSDEIVFPTSRSRSAGAPDVESLIEGETKLFDSRRQVRNGQKSQLRERISQLDQEISGLAGQQAAKTREIELIARELREVEKLWGKSLVSLTKLTALQRDCARLEGENAQLSASVARSKGRIAEIEFQILQIDQDMRAEVTKELRDALAKQAELLERRVASEDQLKRIDIRAPQSGIVHQLGVHTIGGVVTGSETLMLIVPEGDTLLVEARIAPQDIDHVRLGQHAIVRFSTFNQRTTPELHGEVVHVGADLSHEQQSGRAFFVARISLAESEVKRLGNLKLVPGMPAEAYVRTGERTAMSYLMKPLSDQLARAFIER